MHAQTHQTRDRRTALVRPQSRHRDVGITARPAQLPQVTFALRPLSQGSVAKEQRFSPLVQEFLDECGYSEK